MGFIKDNHPEFFDLAKKSMMMACCNRYRT